MSKRYVHITVKNDSGVSEYDVNSIYNSDTKTIIYMEPDMTKVKFNYSDKTLSRENDSLLMNYRFKNDKLTEGTMYIKGMDKTLYVTIKTINIIRKKDDISINYLIDKDNFTYTIEVK